MEFLEHVYQLELEHEEDKAYNKVTRQLEGFLLKNKFDAVNDVLKEVDLDRIEPWVQRAFLAVTFPYKEKLSGRHAFYDRVFKEIELLQGTHVANSLIGGLI